MKKVIFSTVLVLVITGCTKKETFDRELASQTSKTLREATLILPSKKNESVSTNKELNDVAFDQKTSQSPLGKLSSEILGHLYSDVESIEYNDDKTAFVKANIGLMKCGMHFNNTTFQAQLSDGTITGWKLTKINCQ